MEGDTVHEGYTGAPPSPEALAKACRDGREEEVRALLEREAGSGSGERALGAWRPYPAHVGSA